MLRSLVGSEMCIRDRMSSRPGGSRNNRGTRTLRDDISILVCSHRTVGYRGTSGQRSARLVGKAKAAKQIACKRGWWNPESNMMPRGRQIVPRISQDDRPGRFDSPSIRYMCSDLLNEKALLQDLVEERGHLFDESPKCHPEINCVGIEISWAKI